MPGGLPSSPAVAQMLVVAPAMIKSRPAACTPAPEAIMACMVEGLQVDLDTALRLEAAPGPAHDRHPIQGHDQHLLLQHERHQGRPVAPKDVPRYKPAKVGLLGAGMMGAGIAYAQTSKGIATVLKDVSLDKAEHGKAYSAKLTQARVDKGRMTAEKQAEIWRASSPRRRSRPDGLRPDHRGRVREPRTQGQGHAGGRAHVGAGGFFASNTSTLPITGLARPAAMPEVHRHPFLQPGGQDAAGGDHPGKRRPMTRRLPAPSTTCRPWANCPSWSNDRAASSPAGCLAPS